MTLWPSKSEKKAPDRKLNNQVKIACRFLNLILKVRDTPGAQFVMCGDILIKI